MNFDILIQNCNEKAFLIQNIKKINIEFHIGDLLHRSHSKI